ETAKPNTRRERGGKHSAPAGAVENRGPAHEADETDSETTGGVRGADGERPGAAPAPSAPLRRGHADGRQRRHVDFTALRNKAPPHRPRRHPPTGADSAKDTARTTPGPESGQENHNITTGYGAAW